MQLNDMAGLTCNFGNPVLAGGTTTTLLTTNATILAINGRTHTLAAVSNVQPATNDANTGAPAKPIPPGYGSIFVIGAVRPASPATQACSTTLGWVQGEIVPITASASATDYTPGAFVDLPEFPVLPDNFCPIGFCTVRVASSNSVPLTLFSAGLTVTGAKNSNTTAIEFAYGQLATLPSRPTSL
jgi:hypothetical protein